MADSRLGVEQSPRKAIVGREAELVDLTAALQAGGAIVGLHGQSGIGKSRLLAEVADQLASTRAPGAVVLLDCREVTSTGELADALERAGRRSTAHILLDHTDHLRDGFPELLQALVDSRGATCVVTSVRPLDAVATHTVTLGPLAVPPTDEAPAEPTTAMQLFATRVADVAPWFEVDEETRALLTVLVRRLGGVPLALELAAARYGLLGLHELVRMVLDADHGIDALGDSARGRHQSMAAALEWSIRHLDPDSRDLLLTLSVFQSDVDATAITHVHGGDLSAVLDALSVLVDLRLVDPVRRGPGLRRFRLPPLVATAARRHLEAEALGRLRDRHAAHYVGAVAVGADLMLDGREHELEPTLLFDLGEARRAVDWLTDEDRIDEACRLGADLALILPLRAAIGRMLPTLTVLLDRAAEASAENAARVRLAACASVMAAATRPDEADRAMEWWKLGTGALHGEDPRLTIWSHLVRAWSLPITGDFASASASLAAGLELAERTGHLRWQARFEALTGMLHHQLREFPQAVAMGERALRRSLATDDRVAQIRVGLLLHLVPDDAPRANPLLPSLEVLLGYADDLGDLDMQRRLAAGLVIRAVHDGETAGADRWIDRLLGQVQPHWVPRDTTTALLMTLFWADHHGRLRDVARLAGGIRPWEEVTLGWMPPATADRYHEALAATRRELGEEAYEAEFARGSGAGLDANVRHARAIVATVVTTRTPPTSAARGTDASRAALTPRELQVLTLMVEGLRNKEIAERLGSSAKSVMHQTSGIYRKLGVRGRAEATAVALRERLVPTS